MWKPPVADEDADPCSRAERKLTDTSPARIRVVAHDELEHLGEVVVDAPERDPQLARDAWYRHALHDHGEENDDEDDAVEVRRVVH